MKKEENFRLRSIIQRRNLALFVFYLLVVVVNVYGNPTSKAYIPFRTDPYDQPVSKNGSSEDFRSESSDDHQDVNNRRQPPPRFYEPDKAVAQNECPLQFSLGVSHRSHAIVPGLGGNMEESSLGIQQPPIIYPILPWEGPGRQVLYATQYEHLDMLTPSKGNVHVSSSYSEDGENDAIGGDMNFIKEGLTEHIEFPLLFESSAFQTSPIVADVNGDGVLDTILTDYHGGLYVIGLEVAPNQKHRYFFKAQVPRMYVRRQWMEAMVNETLGIDPYEAEKKAEEEERKTEEARKASRDGDGDPKDITEIDRDQFRANEERPSDPYHSYFEYSYGSSNVDHETILRGVTANVLEQDHDHIKGLEERRNRNHYPKNNQTVVHGSFEEEEKNQKVIHDSFEEEADHRRLQETMEGEQEGVEDNMEGGEGDDITEWGGFADDMQLDDDDDDDVNLNNEDPDNIIDGEEIKMVENSGDGENLDENGDQDASFASRDDDEYPHYDDYSRHEMYDDYYQGRYSGLHADYFDDKHYIRLPPHILSTPVLAEMSKLYSNDGETENLLFLSVSYYFDEDEYEGFFSYKRFENTDHGDESETQRGMYTANAIMIFHLGDNPRWGRQEHLDLSGDHSAPVNLTLVGSIPMREDNSKLGAFALSSPTIADIDGDGSTEILMGTSMGFLYVMDARNLFVKDNWPVQFQYAIESRVLVEDVRGDTNLEIFVTDVGGNVLCLDHTGKKIWHRNLPYSVANKQKKENSQVLGSSPMVLGDVNGDGVLDLVILLQIKSQGQGSGYFLFAISADTGKDLDNKVFPMNIWTKNMHSRKYNVGEDFVHVKLPPPLLVDLHGDQDHISDYIKRNGTKWTKPEPKLNRDDQKVPHGGSAGGLHVVQPIDTYLVIVEGGSGCTQSIEVGEKIDSAVQADDIHGTNKLDLVISTVFGNVITMESEAPFHPLNVWNNGELRSRTNAAAHGYSASQGIFVHEVSRQYRDIFGVYVPVTFEIFDNRPNIQNEQDKRKYNVEIKAATSLSVFRKEIESPGIYTERVYIPFGPGYYQLSVILKTSHGLIYEDAFHIGYNVNYMSGFSMLLWLPLTIATICVFLMGAKKQNQNWDEDDFESNGQGILGNNLPE